MTYQAIVTTLKSVRKHPNADRLNLASCYWNQVVVWLDAKEWDLWVYFPVDWRLSEDFCSKNDLIRRKDENWNICWWMFNENRKIKIQKFRWEKSEWFWCPMHYFHWYWYNFTEWDMFTHIWDVMICEKFITLTTKNAQNKTSKKIEVKSFPKHIDTENIKYYRNNLEDWDLLTITLKLHWTSQRQGLVPVELASPRWKFWSKKRSEFRKVLGTRNVILSDNSDWWYHSIWFRKQAEAKITPRKNEVWYYEIVWYEFEGKPIMGKVSLKSLDKDTRDEYKWVLPEIMTYSYWLPDWASEIYVYRIALVNEDWQLYDLPRSKVKERCRDCWVKHVPELEQLIFKKKDLKKLQKKLELYHDWIDPIDSRHWREWVCIRVDKASWDTRIYKMKNFLFLSLEHAQKESWDLDIEEAS